MNEKMEGFTICDCFNDGQYCEIKRYNDNNGDDIVVTFTFKDKFLKFSNKISNIENLEFILNKISSNFEKLDYELALYVNDFDNYYRNNNGDEKYKRNDIKCSSFIASLGSVIGLNVKSRKLDGYVLFLPDNYNKMDENSFNRLKEISSSLKEFDNVTIMLCGPSYENNEIYENEAAKAFLNELEQTKIAALSK